MAFSIPAITTNFANVIRIADADGTHTMTLTGIQEPSKLPEVLYPKRNVKVTKTRPGASHSGYNVYGSFGASTNGREMKLELPVLLAANVTQLRSYYDARPGLFIVSVDAGTTKYYAMFKEGGLVVENYQWNQRVFQKASLDIYLITTTTQTLS